MNERNFLNTEVGYREPSHRVTRESAFDKFANFYKKNKGLVFRLLFWSVLIRVIFYKIYSIFVELDKPNIQRLFVCHHKSMTTYFSAVAQVLAFAFSKKFRKINTMPAEPLKADYVLCMHGHVDFKALREHRGVHVVRDPRDMIVSGYHYHKWCHEPWVHLLDDNGESFQQKLRSRPKSEGLRMQIEHFAYMNRQRLLDWPIDNPNFLEVPYESLMGDDKRAVYDRVYTHLQLDGRAKSFAVDVMTLFEVDSRRGRSTNETAERSHLRSGKSGQWRSELEPEHLEYIDKLLGDVLRKYGYYD